MSRGRNKSSIVRTQEWDTRKQLKHTFEQRFSKLNTTFSTAAHKNWTRPGGGGIVKATETSPVANQQDEYKNLNVVVSLAVLIFKQQLAHQRSDAWHYKERIVLVRIKGLTAGGRNVSLSSKTTTTQHYKYSPSSFLIQSTLTLTDSKTVCDVRTIRYHWCTFRIASFIFSGSHIKKTAVLETFPQATIVDQQVRCAQRGGSCSKRRALQTRATITPQTATQRSEKCRESKTQFSRLSREWRSEESLRKLLEQYSSRSRFQR